MDFDPQHSEDENFLTYAIVLARQSVSKKGHMGAILVRPDARVRPDVALAPEQAKECFDAKQISARIITYANNTPTLWHSNPKNVAELHAEALCISRAARLGVATAGSTLYVTFPPCNECLKLIVGAGIKRCVFRKGYRYPSGEAALAAARMHGLELAAMLPQQGETESREAYAERSQLDHEREQAREQRAKLVWEALNDTRQSTADRAKGWWSQYSKAGWSAVRELQALYGGPSKKAANKAASESNRSAGAPTQKLADSAEDDDASQDTGSTRENDIAKQSSAAKRASEDDTASSLACKKTR